MNVWFIVPNNGLGVMLPFILVSGLSINFLEIEFEFFLMILELLIGFSLP